MTYLAGHATAKVSSWSDDDGWGVVDAPGLTGGCWVHFSVINGSGIRNLTVGSTVEVEWETAEQDGYHFRATRVTT